MGLFDMFKKLDKDAIDKFGDNLLNNLQKTMDNVVNNNSSETSSQSEEATNSIPEEYNAFPFLEKKAVSISCKKEANYHRCTMQFNNVSSEEIANYIAKIESLGYVKGSKVRYDKDNTYIIVDDDTYYDLELVFHIKI